MSSKFFTWTKGERKTTSEALRSAGVVPIPAECISIKGMEYGRSTKGNIKGTRKPLPLCFDQSPELASVQVDRNKDSIALHDAAVQSATSLMAVVNDMLRSPQVSAHLEAQRQSGLTPMHGRPRSRTAPSTPLVEAPSMEPVELPGSLLAGKKSILSLHQSLDGKAAQTFVQSPLTQSVLAAEIERPRSSPQEITHSFSAYPRQSSDSFSRTLQPPSLSPRSKSSSPHPYSKRVQADTTRTLSSEDTLVATGTGPTTTSRPALSVLQPMPWKSPAVSEARTDSFVGSSYNVARTNSEFESSAPSQYRQRSTDPETLLLEQIALLRSTHEAHVSSLKQAHEKELQSHRSYIALLEQRRGLIPASRQPLKRQLTLDTSHGTAKGNDLRSADASATTLQSFSSLESQKRVSQEAIAEAEALKRKLSLAKKAQVESGEIRRERDSFRDAAERSDRRIVQLKDIIRKSKEHEKSLKNAVSDLEARLVSANNERTDVLEGFHEATEQIRQLAVRERALKLDVEDLRSRLFYAGGRHSSDTTLALPDTNAQCRPEHARTKSDVLSLPPKNDPIMQQIRELERTLATRDATIEQLKMQKIRTRPGDTDKRTTDLQASLDDHRRMLAKALADCERYNSLLHSELRRQSRTSLQRPYTDATPGEIEALAEASEKARFVAESSSNGGEDPKALLEREIEYCLKEIVLYKLDIRGFKKDLRKAQAQIDELKELGAQRPPTPDRESASSIKSNTSSEKRERAHTASATPSGLGISLAQVPQTPTRTVVTATVDALMAATPPVPDAPMSPPSQPKTPLGAHKKLPKPPVSRTPSPLPEQVSHTERVKRGDTPRSLSESIISSYGKRETPQQASDFTPPETTQEPNAAGPLTSYPPISRFASSPRMQTVLRNAAT